jgi:prolyl-tRNA synthetase
MAPPVVLCPIGYDRSADVKAAADACDEAKAAGITSCSTSRRAPGAMFADWELIGIPHRVVISDRGGRMGSSRSGRRDAAATRVTPEWQLREGGLER